jgi:hypothetical protein
MVVHTCNPNCRKQIEDHGLKLALGKTPSGK